MSNKDLDHWGAGEGRGTMDLGPIRIDFSIPTLHSLYAKIQPKCAYIILRNRIFEWYKTGD